MMTFPEGMLLLSLNVWFPETAFDSRLPVETSKM